MRAYAGPDGAHPKVEEIAAAGARRDVVYILLGPQRRRHHAASALVAWRGTPLHVRSQLERKSLALLVSEQEAAR